MKFDQAVELMDEGQTLNEEESRLLELSLVSHPSDVFTRMKLLGYYRARGRTHFSNYVTHIAWIVKNHPDGEIAIFAVMCTLNGDHNQAYRRVKLLWLENLKSQPANARIILNAIKFFVENGDLETAFACLPTLKDAEAKEGDFISMAGVYELLSNSASATNAPSRERLLNEAVIWCQKAAQMESEGGWLFASIKLIKLLFAAGRLVQSKDAATTLLAKASIHPEKHGYAIYVSNNVLGKIALIEGSPTSASKYLLASVEVSDTELLLSKAPDMTLAQAVLTPTKQK
jgi:hypothetical protein